MSSLHPFERHVNKMIKELRWSNSWMTNPNLLFSLSAFCSHLRNMSLQYYSDLDNSEQWTNCEKLMLFNIQLFCPQMSWKKKTTYFNTCSKQIELREDRTKNSVIMQWSRLKRQRLMNEKQNVNFSVRLSESYRKSSWRIESDQACQTTWHRKTIFLCWENSTERLSMT